jgi:hypothetical protein
LFLQVFTPFLLVQHHRRPWPSCLVGLSSSSGLLNWPKHPVIRFQPFAET